ncbi:hypothetical protein SCLARK_001450 [Spiroplasma clarkii]|uniref:MSC_0882 family membrane protein n=1 Tax=Spiroplasma clarkii TaxID=2139 RepID=UPI000B5699F4|nr:hypothetical protein [Spiroplasma clarkii]ARU91967.1 hypothetical protein SCLARK_001450 [Spiroplasma clarkii]
MQQQSLSNYVPQQQLYNPGLANNAPNQGYYQPNPHIYQNQPVENQQPAGNEFYYQNAGVVYENPPTMPADYDNSFYANNYQQASPYQGNQYQQFYQNQVYQNYGQPQGYVVNGAYGYEENVNYAPNPYNNYQHNNGDSYASQYKKAKVIEKPMVREIRSEKFRNIFLMFAGIIGIVATSLMLAVYYNANEAGVFMGIKKESVMYPFASIFFLLLAIACFGWATTDLALLTNGVSKFLYEQKSGYETIPYFIIRNYKNMIAREVYVNWIAFATYIVGSICLGILYFLQGQYQGSIDRGVLPEVKFFFWTIGTLKSFKTDITINIIILFAMFGFHIFNVVSTRSRKNNIAGYYNHEPISPTEIREIKKRANRTCLIIMLVILALILIAIIIPWLIIRKKQGKPLRPWSLT